MLFAPRGWGGREDVPSGAEIRSSPSLSFVCAEEWKILAGSAFSFTHAGAGEVVLQILIFFYQKVVYSLVELMGANRLLLTLYNLSVPV